VDQSHNVRRAAVTPIIETEGLGKRYGRTTALTDCTLRVPAGRIVGLIGPNGAGKSTLLGLTCGLIAPTTGSIAVLGNRPAAGAAQLARVGFVAQDVPVYSGLSVADHLRLGARLNPRRDMPLAQRRIQRLGLNPAQKAGRLSGGQQAQLALTVAAAKRAELLILDEPVASLDPLARSARPAGAEVIHADHTARETTVILRSTDPIPGADHADLEDVGFAYMTRAAEASVRGPSLTPAEAQR
jgi:ABC-2 type transport system ATP-binding protein